MLLAHLSDLHLGHRAYDRAEGGRNVRERDVAVAFQRAVQEVVRLKPDLVFLAGDIFDRPDPTPGALVSLAQGLETFRSFLPSTPVFMVAGARDTPRRLGDPGPLAALDPFPHVETATSSARSLYLKDLEAHVFLVPHGSVVRRPYPELRTRPEAKWNLLMAYASVGTGPGEGLPLDPGPWDYVALGYLHQQQEVAPRVFYAGSLERVGPEPWRDAVQEKGFLTFDLESGTSRFHAIRGRAVVALAPIRFPRGESRHLTGRVQEVLGEVPGGIEGKIVRLRVEGLSPEEVRKEDEGLFAPLRDQALHLAIEVDDFQKLAEDNRLPLISRDRGFAYRVLRDRLRGEEDGEEAVALMVDLVPVPSSSGDSAGLEEELLIRELQGSRLPRLGDLSMEAGEGLLAWVGGDGRVLRRFLGTLLWGVGLAESPGDGPSPASPGLEPSLAIKLGVHEGSFWVQAGPPVSALPGKGIRGPKASWGLSPVDVALAWCGAGEETPEGYLEAGARVLASARGGGCSGGSHGRAPEPVFRLEERRPDNRAFSTGFRAPSDRGRAGGHPSAAPRSPGRAFESPGTGV
ncbi:exonuclease SbcCD subunit D [Gemmatimonadota bacterium]